jgi:hypothetical protein
MLVAGFFIAVAADVPPAVAVWETAAGLFWDACMALGHWLGAQVTDSIGG